MNAEVNKRSVEKREEDLPSSKRLKLAEEKLENQEELNEDSLKARLLGSECKRQWQTVGIRHHHGFCVPLFSIKTNESLGIGEFLDLHLLVDLCIHLGMDVVQLLPLNELTDDDVSPFRCLSAFALEPRYISFRGQLLQKLEGLAKQDAKVENYMKELHKLNEGKRVQYSDVKKYKLACLRELWSQEAFRKEVENASDFNDFKHKFDYWLRPYLEFHLLSVKNHHAPWSSWPETDVPGHPSIEKLLQGKRIELGFLAWLQFLCFKQLSEAKEYANSKKVFIKGDLPFGLNSNSVDVWQKRDQFRRDLSVGAPPDYYTEEGQNWDLPPCDWEEMQKDGFAWWKHRLEYAANFYHIYRLDHIAGFYRVWAIEQGHAAKEGHFLPLELAQWLKQGEMVMKMMIHAANILPIGEDLGTVHQEIRDSLSKLGVCGTKVLRWERKWNENDHPFIEPKKYSPLSMTTASTHDSSTLPLWWSQSSEESKAYCRFKGWEYKEKPEKNQIKEILKETHHSGSLFHINLLFEYLNLIPKFNVLSPEEQRINVPGSIGPNNWTIKIPFKIEEMIQSHETKEINDLMATGILNAA